MYLHTGCGSAQPVAVIATVDPGVPQEGVISSTCA
jgi:hypothetical protein